MTTTTPLIFTPDQPVHLSGAGTLEFVPDAPPPPAPGRPTFGRPFISPFLDGSYASVAHFQLSCYEFGGGWDGLGTVSGYSQSAANAAALGFDAFAFDTGG